MAATSSKDILATRKKDGVKFGRELRKEFMFDEGFVNLNHGSFGTYPRALQPILRSFQERAEARPDHFIRYIYPQLLDESRAAIAKVLNAPTETLVFIPNATTGINTVLRNLTFTAGDHILYFATIYGACEKTVTYITETTPAAAVKIEYTYPVEDEYLLAQFRRKVSEVEKKGGRVKIAIFDTVVSNPGVRMPFEELVKACKELGVLSCVDGAHGVGHLEIDLSVLAPDFFVSNCHKWLLTPRGCAIFHVPLRNQPLLRSTLPTSHGFIPLPRPGEPATPINNPLPSSGTPKSPWVQNFEFVGTIDNAPYLCIPSAIRWREETLGGEKVITEYCQTLAREGAGMVAKMLGTRVLENSKGTLGRCCMANVLLPLDVGRVQEVGMKSGIEKEKVGVMVRDWASKVLLDDYDTFMALMFYGGEWWVRLSAQVYLEMADFEWAGEVLGKLCERVKKGEWCAVTSKL